MSSWTRSGGPTGCHGHCPHGLFMALMADVEHGVALSSSDLQLVVDLRDERHTHQSPCHRTVGRPRSLRVANRARSTSPALRRHQRDVVDEHDAERFEVVHDELVVNDLVVAKDRWGEDRVIQSSALMAFSTPHRTRGAASTTLSTFTKSSLVMTNCDSS